MLNLNIEVESGEGHLRKRSGRKEKQSLRQYLREKMRSWINSLLEGERDEFLGRGRYQGLDAEHDNLLAALAWSALPRNGESSAQPTAETSGRSRSICAAIVRAAK